MKKAKEPIRLRQKKLKNGGFSLYLDIYFNGIRQYEFLRLYLIPERTRQDKDMNAQTLQLAQAIKAQRIVELNNGSHGFSKAKNKVLFFDYLQREASKHASNGWNALQRHCKVYERNKGILITSIDPIWVAGFKAYLDTGGLSQNSKKEYFAKLKQVFRTAYNEGIIADNPARGIVGFRAEDSKRTYLTLDELKQLTATPTKHEGVKRMFLFSCLTGLRYSDIDKLAWDDVQSEDGFTRLVFRQKKTKGQEYLDISEQATGIMGEPKKGESQVFRHIPHTTLTRQLKEWVKDAGIKKTITFHCARHTFAVMMLELGADIYTLSKLLGHRDLSTTQIYAKVVDEKKRKAVELIPNLF